MNICTNNHVFEIRHISTYVYICTAQSYVTFGIKSYRASSSFIYFVTRPLKNLTKTKNESKTKKPVSLIPILLYAFVFDKSEDIR